jgi:hypothetical protein
MILVPEVGTVLGTFDAPLERARVWRVDWSVGLDRPEYQDPEVAREAGHPDIPVPPGALLFFSFLDGDAWLERAGIRYDRSLAVRRRLVLHRTLHVGDSVSGAPTITAVERRERERGTSVFVTISTSYESGGSVAAEEHVTYMTRHDKEADGAAS